MTGDQALVRGELEPRASSSGGPNEVIEGCDLFIGLSGPGLIEAESLGEDERRRDRLRDGQPDARGDARGRRALRADHGHRAARTTRTRSTTCSAFPGIFRGALDAGAPRITEEMKLAAAQGIAEVVSDDDLSEDYIIPSVFNRDVAPAVAAAVVEEAKARRASPASREETGTFSTVE